MNRPTNRQLILTGWWCFVASATFFIVSALRAGDLVALIGALFFMAANIAFLIPQYRPRLDEARWRDREDDRG